MRYAYAWKTLAAALVASGIPTRPSHATSAGPVEVSARGVEFRSYDEQTGALRAHLVADSASMVGETAALERARLARYDESGRLVLEVGAARGTYTGGRGARLHGGVEIEWRLQGGTVRFGCDDIAWDEASDTFRTDSAVVGRVLRRGPRAASAESSVVDIEGRGFTFATAESRGEIVRDAVVRMSSRSGADRRGTASFIATADKGLVFASTKEGEPTRPLIMRMRGPVGTVSNGSSARADSLDLRFTPVRDGRLELEGGTFRGTVRALVSQGGEESHGDEERQGTGALLPGSFLPRLPARTVRRRKAGSQGRMTELRAEVIDVSAASRRVVLHGTSTDPARVIFDGGELRGARVELTEGRVSTDGGAPSEFIW